MEIKQDFFISHASDDKSAYIQPLAECLTKREITFWLDCNEIQWGDTLALKINDGLRESRHVILCLSKAFLARPWTEGELNAAFAMNINKEDRKVLSLILNNKDIVLERYPIINGLVYREYSHPDTVANELASLIKKQSFLPGNIHVTIESIHTGQLSNIMISPNASVEWLTSNATRGTGLHESLDTGGFQSFHIRWVLVDVNAEEEWKAMSRSKQQKVRAIIKTNEGINIASIAHQRLSEIGIYNNIIFHLYAVEDINLNMLNGGICFEIRE